MILNINDIKENGPWGFYALREGETRIFDLKLIFMKSDNLFYNDDGTGPWEIEDINEIQEIIDTSNKNGIVCFFEKFNGNTQISYI